MVTAHEMGAPLTAQNRIYKPKYMDDASKTPEKDKKAGVEMSLSSISKDSAKEKESTKPAGRARSRSIWGRSKKDKTAAS